MHGAAVLYAICAQASLLVGLAVCVWLRPSYVLGKNEGGVSNYATDRRTVLPYSLAFLLDAVLTLLTAIRLLQTLHTYRPLIALLVGQAGLLMIVLASSYGYKKNEFWHRFHFFWGIVFITYESLFGIVLLGYLHRYFVGYVALAAQLAGDAVCILSLRNVVQRLFAGQVITSVAFAVLLCSAIFII